MEGTKITEGWFSPSLRELTDGFSSLSQCSTPAPKTSRPLETFPLVYYVSPLQLEQGQLQMGPAAVVSLGSLHAGRGDSTTLTPPVEPVHGHTASRDGHTVRSMDKCDSRSGRHWPALKDRRKRLASCMRASGHKTRRVWTCVTGIVVRWYGRIATGIANRIRPRVCGHWKRPEKHFNLHVVAHDSKRTCRTCVRDTSVRRVSMWWSRIFNSGVRYLSILEYLMLVRRPRASAMSVRQATAPSRSDGRTRLLLWQRCESQIWLYDSHVREQLVRLFALHARVDDDIVAYA